MPVSTLNAAWADISLPRSHVTDLAGCSGSVDIVLANAFFIVIARHTQPTLGRSSASPGADIPPHEASGPAS